jgi:hypothetical protein
MGMKTPVFEGRLTLYWLSRAHSWGKYAHAHPFETELTGAELFNRMPSTSLGNSTHQYLTSPSWARFGRFFFANQLILDDLSIR